MRLGYFSTFLATTIASVTLTLCARDVCAQPLRVAVGPVSGPQGDEVAERLGSILELHTGEVQAIPASTYYGVASRLGVVSRIGESDLASVAHELRLDAIIVGELTRRGRAYGMRLRIARGRDGVIIGTVNLELGHINDLDRLEPDLWQELRTHFLAAAPERAGRNPSNSSGQNPNTSNTTTSNPSSGSTGDPNTGTPPETGPSAVTPTITPTTAGLGFVQLGLTAGLSGRSWRMPVLGESTPRSYDNPGFFEGRIEARAYYRAQHDRLGIGAYATGAMPLVISSRGTSTEGTSIALQTTAYDVGGGLALAYLPPGGGAFRGELGFALHSFDINTSRLPAGSQLARMSYLGGRARGEGAVPIVANASIQFSVLFAAEARVTSVGAEARAAFGDNALLCWGIGGAGGFELRFDGAVPGLAVRATAEWLRYRTSFAGRGQLGTGSDSVDDYTRIHAGISYAFGVRAGQ
ncbi:MAG: hypothetical protein Q8Q09_03025 [Deltaproteobacteria bacterium]|nr:hypothetical protein [Deltaproteobacteria bacterium]